jgi:hypothetical protein
MQSCGLGMRDRSINTKLRAQYLQDLPAPSKERIAWQRDQPVRRECSETGFEKLTGFLIVQMQVASQFQNHRFAIGKEIPLLPVEKGTAMDSYDFGKFKLRKTLALPKSFE